MLTNSDSVGPMGWWVDEHESSLRTMAHENRILAEMQETAPERFGAEPVAKRRDEALVARMRQVTAQHFNRGFTLYTRDRSRSWAHNMTIEGAGGMWLRSLEIILFGRTIPYRAQLIGSCVASGAMRALVMRMLAEIVVLGEPEETLGITWDDRNNLAPFAPYHYRSGRKYSNINGNGDGSTCSGQIRGLMNDGFLPCQTEDLESDAWPEPQDTGTYRRWGANNRLLDRFAAHGRVYDLTHSTDITSGDVAKAAIGERLEPSMVCSGWAFRPEKRIGADQWSDEFVIVGNSWGENAHRDGPYFVIRASEHDQWCRSSTQKTIGALELRESDTPAV